MPARKKQTAEETWLALAPDAAVPVQLDGFRVESETVGDKMIVRVSYDVNMKPIEDWARRQVESGRVVAIRAASRGKRRE